MLIGVWIVSFTVLGFLDSSHPREVNPWGCAMMLMSALVHAAWITFDCWLTNQRVDAWRFTAFFLGPLVIWVWLVKAYRAKAAVWIPVSILIYLAPIGLAYLAEVLGLVEMVSLA